ncbi:MAG: diguanylate cyclase [Lachnospiraceae bacterium]|nr:diguanylate cyclase [Lachnospiraceae bacterium]
MNWDYREKYSKEIQEKFDIIERRNRAEYDLAMKAADELLEISGYGSKDRLLYSYAVFNKGFWDYLNGDVDAAIEKLVRIHSILEETGQFRLYARTFSVLGVIYSGMGEVRTAMDYYIKGKVACTKYNVGNVLVFLTVNIGVMYLKFGSPAEAKQCFEEAIWIANMLDNDPDNVPLSDMDKAIINLNLVTSLIALRDAAAAREAFEKACELGITGDGESVDVLIYMLKAQLADLEGNIEERDEAIRKFDEGNVDQAILESFDDMLVYAIFLRKIGKDEEFIRVLRMIDNLAKNTNSPYFALKSLEQKIAYYDKKEMWNDYFAATGDFYVRIQAQQQEINATNAQTLTARLKLEEDRFEKLKLESEKEALRAKSETDPLTGINNRAKINEISETKFNEAMEKGQSFAVQMIDIDNFKEYNDTYGHQAGDEVIKKVAYAVDSLKRHYGVYSGKYGGDEFMVVFIDKEYSEVSAICEELKQKIAEYNIEHKSSKTGVNRVTLSQGTFFGRPNGNSKLWDFVFGADKALYKIKEAGRNGSLVSADEMLNISQISDESVMKLLS